MIRKVFEFFGCCLHSWGMWGGKYIWYMDVYQRRKCTRCGKMEQRKVGPYDKEQDKPDHESHYVS